ncbi:class I SAM-dependent methyltransferase [Spongiibacter sp.]|uniref:class I SAM-dependent methyltransferase n=1 Tax=Spongiibacter sp. TaxID=2024860 RepID=UPI000C64DDAD|nr:class I SAM-dependent methyltransferase [Spongiibacter sp.]MBU72042.1 hypothetical protein [Spongiibacter sp.]
MDSLINLEAIYINHEGKASDKWLSYFACYDRTFLPLRAEAVNLLEIGVQNGGSLEIWAKYFPHAESIVGCDINEECGELQFDDDRISVVVGDATQPETRASVVEHCSEFDIIIDDGSHTSSDIVGAFLTYFSLLRDDGIFVVEDLACSYWQEYEGGLYSASSAMSFFKLLADYINREAWGIPVDAVDFFGRSGFGVEEYLTALGTVQSVEFSPSMCIIRKAQGVNSGMGPRVVAGREFLVQDAIQAVAGQNLQVPSQRNNPDSFLSSRSDDSRRQQPTFFAQLYTATVGESYSEATSSSASFTPNGERVALRLPVSQAIAPIEGFRLDLANQPVAVVLHRLALQHENGEELWCWNSGQENFRNVHGLALRDQPGGLMAACLNNDPQFELAISEEVLAGITRDTCLILEMTATPLLEALPSLLEQPSLQPPLSQSKGVSSPAVIQELSETTVLFRKVVEQRNSTISRQREQLQAQEAAHQQLQAQLHKAEAQLDVLKEFVASAFGNANERI